MCMVGEYGGSIWLGQVDPVARKEHRCGNCRRVIEPCERYHRGTWTWEGELATFKLCDHCHIAAEGWLGKVCRGFVWGEGCQGLGLIYDDLEEHWDEHDWPIKSLDLGRLLVGMRHGWKRRNGQLWPVEMVRAWAEAGAQRAMAVPA